MSFNLTKMKKMESRPILGARIPRGTIDFAKYAKVDCAADNRRKYLRLKIEAGEKSEAFARGLALDRQNHH